MIIRLLLITGSVGLMVICAFTLAWIINIIETKRNGW